MASVEPEVLDSHWTQWLVERNRKGTVIAFWLTIVIYPLFAILDVVVVPREYLPLMFITRIIVVAWSFFHLLTRNTWLYSRYWRWYTSLHALVLGGGIVVMTIPLGGFTTGYYAGITLTMVGAGLLFVWTWWHAALTYVFLTASYLVVGAVLANGDSDWFAGLTNLFFVVSVATVVTAAHGFTRKAAWEQLHNQLVIEQTKANLEQANNQLKKLDKFKSQFFANITHELKTPLAMVLSPLELMISGEMGKFKREQLASLQSMFRNGTKLLKLIQDLLDLSKLEESRVRLNILESDIVSYMKTLTESIKPLIDRKDITLTFDSSSEEVLLWFDKDRLERVIINLLSNAAKFTPPEGQIAVKLGEDANNITISVSDTGPGFPSEMASSIFERFVQVDMDGTRKYGGTGIGLALAKELVDLHGGRIWAQSEDGCGATFFVRLHKGRDHFRPEALERRKRAVEKVDGKREGDGSISDWAVQLAAKNEYRFIDIAEVTERRVIERDLDEEKRGYTALVVENTSDIIRLVHLSLRQQFKVLAAPDGMKGLEIAVEHRPDIIVTDLMMPGIDGYELTRRLRTNEKTRHIPIIMLTARGDIDDRVAGLESGVNLYLTKPFSPKELLTSARSLLNIQAAQADLMLTHRMDSLEQVSSGLAHEINNPLNYIKNSVEIIKKDARYLRGLITDSGEVNAIDETRLTAMDQRLAKMFETTEAGVKRISGTVELMKKYSREGYVRKLVEHDVFVAADEVVKIVRPATGRDVKVSVDCTGDGTIHCIPEEFNQVLTNLIQNAIEAVDEGTGRVDVIGHSDDLNVYFSVVDNGPGMPAEIREKVFSPFFTTKGPGRGMGLGLTITWRVVRSLGGTIEVKSRPGGGTEFQVQVPRVPPSAQLGGDDEDSAHVDAPLNA